MSATQELFKTIQVSEVAKLLGCQNHLFGAAAQLVHIIGLLMVLTSLVLVSLRLLGLSLGNLSVAQLAQATSRLIWVGLGLLAFSGLLIFIPAATNYYPNYIFWTKFILLGLAILVHVTLFRKVTHSENPNPLLGKFTAVLSLTLWFAVAYAGRFIGFV
jgi:hypothetical protein